MMHILTLLWQQSCFQSLSAVNQMLHVWLYRVKWWHHQYIICIIQKLWISLERYEIWQKWKHHSSSLLKAFQIHLYFNTSIFHFIGTLSCVHNCDDRSYLHIILRIQSLVNTAKLKYFTSSKTPFSDDFYWFIVETVYAVDIFLTFSKSSLL